MKTNKQPFVSIMIPARNEQANIKKCLQGVLNQTYKNYEVILMDDNSEDNTKKIAKSFKSKKLRIFSGLPLKKGWYGKSWACHQLSKKAKGKYYLYIDADVFLEPQAVESAVALYQKEKASMLSCFPKQRIKTVGEWLIVPLFDFLALAFLPLPLITKLKTPKLRLAIGQFILFDKETYKKINGHIAVKNKKTEDMFLAENVKRVGGKLIAARTPNLIRCRMYDGFLESLKGLSRTFYEGTHLPPVVFVLAMLAFASVFILPFFLGGLTDPKFLLIIIPLILIRIATSKLAFQSVIVNLILLPIHLILTVLIGFNSLYLNITKQVIWKGRALDN